MEHFELTVSNSQVIPRPHPIEDMHFCPTCGMDTCFCFDRECDAGLIGFCSSCGDDLFRPWTREVA